MLKKLIGVVAVILMALIASVSASGAQGPPPGLPPGPPPHPPNYPPPGHAIACSAIPDFAPGQDVVCNAFTFGAGTRVNWTLFSAPVDLGTSTADANGVATLDTKIPLDARPGVHRIEASGVDPFGNDLVLVFEIRLVPAQAPPPGALPRTGSSSSVPMAQIAVATIVAGGFLLILANRRRAAVVPVTASQRATKV
jgi:LPXTG-motif cell wall-anchored protein